MSGKSKEKLYTQKDLEKKYGLTESLIRTYFRKPRIHKIPKNGGYEQVLCWNRAQVERGLANPGLIRDLERIQAEKERIRSTRDIREYLSGFSIETLREYAGTLSRRFILHIGPTNSGKTHDAVEALKYMPSGLYLGPLRLLALEMFDKLNWQNCPCSLLTGEESIEVFGAEHIASTIELCDYTRHYDVAVIDEAQMITDPYRGDKWVRAIYCVDAAEVHICMAPEAELLICQILESFDADYTVHRHERLAPLVFKGTFRSLRDTRPGDALIVFSRKAVLSVAAELEQKKMPASVIYGALPPASRREEVRRFAAGDTKVVVATDAIGMGVSLPIKRIIFCETRKYDGKETRELRSVEIKQIAGRAGRYGIYDTGEVLTMADEDLIRNSLTVPEEQVSRLTLPFPSEAITSGYPLDTLLEVWNELPPEEGFERSNMSDAVFLYRQIRHIADRFDTAQLYTLITCPVDIKEEKLVTYWKYCMNAIVNGRSLPRPTAGEFSLLECEIRYKQLDIRHQLLRRIGIEEDGMAEKQRLCAKINRFLEEDKDAYLKHCRRCGRVLPSTGSFGICDKCYQKMKAV